MRASFCMRSMRALASSLPAARRPDVRARTGLGYASGNALPPSSRSSCDSCCPRCWLNVALRSATSPTLICTYGVASVGARGDAWKAAHRTSRPASGKLFIFSIATIASSCFLNLQSQGRRQQKISAAGKDDGNALDEAVALGLARRGIPVELDRLEFAERLEDLTDVIGSQGEVEGTDVEAVCAPWLGQSSLCDRSRPGLERGMSRTHPPVMGPPEPEAPVPSRAWRFFSASVYCTWMGMPRSFVPESVSAFCTVSNSTNST